LFRQPSIGIILDQQKMVFCNNPGNCLLRLIGMVAVVGLSFVGQDTAHRVVRTNLAERIRDHAVGIGGDGKQFHVKATGQREQSRVACANRKRIARLEFRAENGVKRVLTRRRPREQYL
jgi:hypothetical protein